MTAEARTRSPMPWQTDATERGFVVRFVLLAAALLLVPWLISLIGLTGPIRYLVPGSAALILAVTFVRRPPEALLALALFVAFYDVVDLHVRGPIKQIDELTIALLFPLALWGAWRSWRRWTWWPREAALVAVVVIGLVSSLLAGVPLLIWFPALVLITKAIVFLYIVMWTPFAAWEVRAGMRIVLAIGITVALLGFVELLDPQSFQRFFGLNEYVRSRNETAVVKSLFTHPAHFGFFTAFVALFTFAQYLVSRRWPWLILALVLSVGTFLSARRRAILALGMGILAALVDGFRRLPDLRTGLRVWVPMVAGLAVVIAFFSPGLVGLYELTIERYVEEVQPTPEVIPGEPPIVGETENRQARVALYNGSVEIAADYFPLGAGLGRYGSWMSRVEYSPLYAEYGLSEIRGLREANNAPAATDTFWPQILGELGVLGTVAYVGFLATIAWMLWREAGRHDVPIMQVLRLGAGMVFAQAMVESLASSMFHSPPRVYLVYLVVGIVASMAWRRDDRAPE